MSQLRILRRMAAIDMAIAVAYRGEMALFMVGLMVTPAVSLLVWRAALETGAQFPVDAEYLTTYFVTLSIVGLLTSSWIAPHLAQAIRLGDLSIWLVRPSSVYLFGIANNLSEKALKLAWLTPMVALLWWIFRDSVRIPGGAGRWMLAGVSVVLAAVLVFAVDFLVAGLAFWLDDILGLDRARTVVTTVLSGQVVPLALMPDWAQGFVAVQPFRFMVSFPLELLLYDLGAGQIALGLALQVGYLGLAVLGIRFVWRRGLRRYTATGR